MKAPKWLGATVLVAFCGLSVLTQPPRELPAQQQTNVVAEQFSFTGNIVAATLPHPLYLNGQNFCSITFYATSTATAGTILVNAASDGTPSLQPLTSFGTGGTITLLSPTYPNVVSGSTIPPGASVTALRSLNLAVTITGAGQTLNGEVDCSTAGGGGGSGTSSSVIVTNTVTTQCAGVVSGACPVTTAPPPSPLPTIGAAQPTPTFGAPYVAVINAGATPFAVALPTTQPVYQYPAGGTQGGGWTIATPSAVATASTAVSTTMATGNAGGYVLAGIYVTYSSSVAAANCVLTVYNSASPTVNTSPVLLFYFSPLAAGTFAASIPPTIGASFSSAISWAVTNSATATSSNACYTGANNNIYVGGLFK